jgi:hypothetical protein
LYLLHTDVAALLPIDDLSQIPPSTPMHAQNDSMRTLSTLPPAVMTPNNLDATPSLPIPIDLSVHSPEPPATRLPPTARQRAVIIRVMANVWGISSPREFQIEAVARLVFEPKTCLFLIRKTGEGKSAVVLTASTLLRGITLVVVPLLGLGCDQVSKAQHHHHKIEAFHLDKN